MSATTDPIKIGISACLLGQPVRYNGGHKASQLCLEVLARHFEFVPLCPEQAIGLGVPREPIRLVGDPQSPRAVGAVPPELDVTDALSAYGRNAAKQLHDISGYILMQKSPSCGMERVKVYQDNGHPVDGGGRGLFAAALMRARPDLPVEEDGRLNDPVLRENFITRIFAYAQWQRLLQTGMTRKALVSFHEHYKYQLMATSRVRSRWLGRPGSRIPGTRLDERGPRCFSRRMAALRHPARRGSHCTARKHPSAHMKRTLGAPAGRAAQQGNGEGARGIAGLV